MKKFFALSYLFVAMTFVLLASPITPPPVEDPCEPKVLTCPDGTQHIVVICNDVDPMAWKLLLCYGAIS